MKSDVDFIVDKSKCIKCGLCSEDCTMGIIKMNDYPEMIEGLLPCIECQHCFAVCPTGAISILGNVADDDDEKPLEVNLEYDELKKLVIKRRSIRRYKNENVDKNVINDLCKTALHAPTAKNNMKIHFSVVDDKTVLDKFREKVYAKLDEIALSGFELAFLKMIVNNRKKTGKDKLFGGAPHMVVVSEPADTPFKSVDSFIALSYFDLLAHAKGLGTLWNGILTMLFNNVLPELKKDLQIPENNKIVYVMVFGKPAVNYPRIIKKDPKNINIIN